MSDPQRPFDPALHQRHDQLLVAALADGKGTALSREERIRAETQVAGCPACAELRRDLLTLGSALRTTAGPARTRDFRLTEADARRLRPAGWRSFWRTIGSARDTFTRPLAVGLTTLGLVGLMVGTVPAMLNSSASQAAPATGGDSTRETSGEFVSAAPAAPEFDAAVASAAAASARAFATPAALGAPAASAAAAQAGETSTDMRAKTAAPETSASEDGTVFSGSGDGGPAAGATGVGAGPIPATSDAALVDEPSGVSALVVLAGILLILGLGLFGLRWSARRFQDG